MKIRIEHESAASLYTDGHHVQITRAQSILSDFTLEKQLQSNWCWAAIASAIGKFYKVSTLSQRQVVSAITHLPVEQLPEETSYSHTANRQMTLHDSLVLCQCFSHWSPGRPSLERLFLELQNGCLPCVRVEWVEGGAHYLVIKGVDVIRKLLHLDDSLYGPSVIPFDEFPRHYMNQRGIWSETYWTAPGNK